MTRDDARQQREVVLHDGGLDGHRGDIDHPESRLPQEKQEKQEAFLVRLGHGAATCFDPVDGHGRYDDDGLTLEVVAHDVPHVGHRRLQPVEARVPLCLVELVEGQCVLRSSRCPGAGHGATRAASSSWTANAFTGRLNPRRCRSPTDSPTTDIADCCMHALGHEHLPRFGLGTQSCRQVGDTSDGGVVEPPLVADASQRGESLGDADRKAELVAAHRPAVGQFSNPSTHRHRHPHGAGGGVRAGKRVVEEDHQTVSGEALQGSFEPEDEVAESSVVLAEKTDDLFGFACLGKRRESS